MCILILLLIISYYFMCNLIKILDFQWSEWIHKYHPKTVQTIYFIHLVLQRRHFYLFLMVFQAWRMYRKRPFHLTNFSYSVITWKVMTLETWNSTIFNGILKHTLRRLKKKLITFGLNLGLWKYFNIWQKVMKMYYETLCKDWTVCFDCFCKKFLFCTNKKKTYTQLN